MLSHLAGTNHKGALRVDVDNTHFLSEALSCGVNIGPISPLGLQPPPLAGLKVYDGIRCSQCSTCRSNNNSLRTHFNNNHSGIVKPLHWPTCKIQRFDTTSPWFEVIPPPPSYSQLSTLELQIQNTIDEFVQPTEG